MLVLQLGTDNMIITTPASYRSSPSVVADVIDSLSVPRVVVVLDWAILLSLALFQIVRRLSKWDHSENTSGNAMLANVQPANLFICP